MLYNCGGPDRSIKLKDLQAGTAVASRYRNRRLGDFLKELDLTEGRSTGLSLIHKELEKNGSLPPVIEADDNRTFFRITLSIHPAFEGSAVEIPIEEDTTSTLIEALRKIFQEYNAGNHADDLAGDLATVTIPTSDELVVLTKILFFCKIEPRKQDEIYSEINMKPHTDTRRKYSDPLVTIGLLERTIPDKPTSPNQKYRLTHKAKELLIHANKLFHI